LQPETILIYKQQKDEFMKQTKLLFLILAMLMPRMSNADPVEINGIYYNLVSKFKTAEVTQNPNKYSGKVVIPKTVTYKNVKYSVTSIGEKTFMGCSELTSVTIPTSVTSIGREAFEGCNGLTSLTLPNGLTSIGEYAFWSCNKVTSLIIPNSVTEIGEYAFGDCGFTSVTIPNGVTSINRGTFYCCNNLSSVTIPNSVNEISSEVFMNCHKLKEITIPNSVTSIGSEAFAGCTSLTSVTIPNSETSIGYRTFSGCSSLTSVVIPNSVTYIGSEAFKGCSKMTTVTIGKGIETISSSAFSDCVELLDVYCYAENVPNIESDAFEDSFIEYAKLHVPTGSLAAYKATSPWKNFKSIVKITAKVSLNKTEVEVEKGKTVTLKATVTPSTLLDKSVTWKSSNTKVATVTSSGKVKGVKAGTATITCTAKVSGTKTTCKVSVFEGSVTLDKTEVTLQKGKTVKLTPTVLPTTLEDKSVTWTSSNTKVATVTSAGKVKGVKAGTATITCTSVATGMSATCKVTVINGTVTLNKTEAYIEKGKTITLKATLTPTDLADKSVTWVSSDTKIATVTSAGKVKGVKYGTATITCTSVATGVKATCQVTVGKVIIGVSEITLKRSRTVTLDATVYPTELADKSVTWKSSDTKIVTVTAEGKIKGIKAGTATITCTSVATGLKGTCTVTVLQTVGTLKDGGDNVEVVTGINEIDKSAVTEPFDVYDLNGHKVLSQVTSLDGLPNGVYIVNGKKILKKY
jgi:uncharacterized protein YjdB